MVVSIDPRRVYLKNPDDVKFKSVKVSNPGKWPVPYSCLFGCVRTFCYTDSFLRYVNQDSCLQPGMSQLVFLFLLNSDSNMVTVRLLKFPTSLIKSSRKLTLLLSCLWSESWSINSSLRTQLDQEIFEQILAFAIKEMGFQNLKSSFELLEGRMLIETKLIRRNLTQKMTTIVLFLHHLCFCCHPCHLLSR